MTYKTIETKIPILQQIQAFEWKKSSEFPIEIPQAVYDRGSTTAKMRKICQDLRINLLIAEWGQGTILEQQILNIPNNTRTFIREVAMLCHNTVWMYGRCVMPDATLTGQEYELTNLGNKPLGDYLYAHDNLKRSEFKFAYIENNWLRHSTIFLNNKPLLLTEVFMPEMVHHV